MTARFVFQIKVNPRNLNVLSGNAMRVRTYGPFD